MAERGNQKGSARVTASVSIAQCVYDVTTLDLIDREINLLKGQFPRHLCPTNSIVAIQCSLFGNHGSTEVNFPASVARGPRTRERHSIDLRFSNSNVMMTRLMVVEVLNKCINSFAGSCNYSRNNLLEQGAVDSRQR